MARNERQEDGGRGGVSTITRPGTRQRPPATVRPPAGPRPAPEQGQRPAGRGPATAPGGQAIPNVQTAPSGRPTAPAARPGAAPTARPGTVPAATRPGSHRLPFVLLLCGLLGGALISALVISTTLAQGAFEINNLQNSTTAQAKQLQSLEEEVAQAQSTQQIATRATKLGMVGIGQQRFLDLKTGKTATDADPHWVGSIPGYYP
jgi:hypothetical protein